MVPNRVSFVKLLFAHEVDIAFYNKGFKPVIAPYVNITILYIHKVKKADLLPFHIKQSFIIHFSFKKKGESSYKL